MDWDDIPSVIAMLIVAVLCTWFLTAGCVINHMEDRAVAAGVAEYYLDADHERQWRWKTNGVER